MVTARRSFVDRLSDGLHRLRLVSGLVGVLLSYAAPIRIATIRHGSIMGHPMWT